MDLLINGQSLNEAASGIRSYVANLINELAGFEEHNIVIQRDGQPLALSKVYPSLQTDSGAKKSAHSERGGFYQILKTLVPPPIKLTIARRRAAVRKYPFRHWLYHEPNNILDRHKGPTVVTVHDLSTIKYPEYHPESRAKHFAKYLQQGMSRADQIITVSKTVKNELIEEFGIAEDRVTAVPLGVHVPQRINATPEIAREERADPYVIVVGAIEPRKNLHAVVDAFKSLPAYLRRDWRIVHAGPLGWGYRELREDLVELGEQGVWVELGVVSPEELSSLYSGAAFLIFPSIYEGFGLPPIEAMAHGCPSLVSDIPVHREVCGQAAEFAVPGDIESLAEKMLFLMEHPEVRNALSEKGRLHAQQYTWRATCAKTLEVYTSVSGD